MNQNLEITIEKKNKNYVAKCKLFPLCKGLGKTKTEALKKLSASISKFISNLVGSSLEEILTSSNYTQVLLDQTKPNKKEKIVFNLNSNNMNILKTFLFKVSSFNDEDSTSLPYYDPLSTIELQNELNLNANDGLKDQSNDALLQLLNYNKPNNDPESYVFGFPINFN